MSRRTLSNRSTRKRRASTQHPVAPERSARHRRSLARRRAAYDPAREPSQAPRPRSHAPPAIQKAVGNELARGFGQIWHHPLAPLRAAQPDEQTAAELLKLRAGHLVRRVQAKLSQSGKARTVAKVLAGLRPQITRSAYQVVVEMSIQAEMGRLEEKTWRRVLQQWQADVGRHAPAKGLAGPNSSTDKRLYRSLSCNAARRGARQLLHAVQQAIRQHPALRRASRSQRLAEMLRLLAAHLPAAAGRLCHEFPVEFTDSYLALAAADDPEGVATPLLWKRMLPQIASLAREYASDRSLAADSDLLQEAFLKFTQVIPKYQPDRLVRGGTFSSWMLVAIRHRFIDVLRREGRQPSNHDGQGLSGDDPAELQVLREAVHECICVIRQRHPPQAVDDWLRWKDERIPVSELARKLEVSYYKVYHGVRAVNEDFKSEFLARYGPWPAHHRWPHGLGGPPQ